MNATSPSSTPQASTTPSSAYALEIEIVLDSFADIADLMRGVLATRADVRSMETLEDGTRRVTVACADPAQQDAVRAAIGTSLGANATSIRDATFEMHRGGKLAVAPRTLIRNAD